MQEYFIRSPKWISIKAPTYIFIFIAILNCVFSSRIDAQKTLEFSPKAVIAYRQIMDLKLNEASNSILLLKKAEPDNYISYFLENYVDFFKIFIGENKNEFKRLEPNKGKRLDLISTTSRNSPYYLYCQAEINLQWALARLKFDEKSKAFFEIKDAYNLLTENNKKFPTFIANNKSLGVLHAALSTIPDNYKWGVKLISGMSGTIDQGMKELQSVMNFARNNPDFIFGQEAAVMYAFTALHLNNDPDNAWLAIKNSKLNASTSPLACFALANLSVKSGQNENAINYLLKRPKGREYYPFHYLDLLLGMTKLQRLDRDANIYLEQFIKNYKGRNYLKEAYQKLAWYYLINMNPAGYILNMAKVKKFGVTLLDEDKNAQKEAENGEVPNPDILKGRLLFDGGYFSKASKQFNSINANTLTNDQRLELKYRIARVFDELGKSSEAIRKYDETIKEGKSSKAYYACSAALYQGQLYEKLGDYSKAKAYFNYCLQLSPSDYKTSLHQKAQAGLIRLK